MRLKLDENLGLRGAGLLKNAGHEVATVSGQSMCSASDRELLSACRRENRCLVTLDLDFANPLVFPPSKFCGIAVLRLPPKPAPDDLLDAIRTLAIGLEQFPIDARLWVVQRGRIRKYQPEGEVE